MTPKTKANQPTTKSQEYLLGVPSGLKSRKTGSREPKRNHDGLTEWRCAGRRVHKTKGSKTAAAIEKTTFTPSGTAGT